MIRTAKQLKDKVRNLSGGDSSRAQTLIRNYMMERFLERMVEGAEPTPEEKKEMLFLFKPEYYLKRYGDKEFYAEGFNLLLFFIQLISS